MVYLLLAICNPISERDQIDSILLGLPAEAKKWYTSCL